jgi:hypothetical protein
VARKVTCGPLPGADADRGQETADRARSSERPGTAPYIRGVRRQRGALGALLVGLVATACANPGYDARTARGDLVDAGLTGEQAECVTREPEQRFGDQRLNARSDATQADHARVVEILDECEVDVTTDATPSS